MSEGISVALDLRDYVRDVPDFPTSGILFKDLSPLLGNPAAFRQAIEQLAQPFRGDHVDAIVGIESRGFTLGGAVAYALGTGFVPVRKLGKLPGPTTTFSYSLEYGEATLEIQTNVLRAKQRVVIVDDVLATGGTANATVALVEELGGQVLGLSFLVELTSLGGRQAIGDRRIVSLLEA